MLRGTVAAHPESRAALLALAAAALHAGQVEDAAKSLQALLAGFAVPAEEGFAALADRIAALAGAAGWCGLAGDGALIVSPGPHATAPIQASAGSATLRVHPGAVPLHAALPGPLPPGPLQPGPLQPGPLQPGPLRLRSPDGPWIGSGLDPARRHRAQGCAALDADGALHGWAWTPWDPDAPASLTMLAPGRPPLHLLADGCAVLDGDAGLALRRGFRVPADRLPDGGAVRVLGPDGAELAGSPVTLDNGPAAHRAAARRLACAYPVLPGDGGPDPDRWRPLPVADAPAGIAPASVTSAGIARTTPPRRPIDVVIPVHRGAADLLACLRSLRRRLPPRTRIVLVDDASTEPELLALLRRPGRGATVLRHAANQGFPAAANTGLRHAAAAADGPRDVLLLNPDTLAPPGLPGRLQRIAYSASGIGSVTPLTNDGTLTSYPHPGHPAAMPGPDEADALDRQAAAANGRGTVDLPTAVGFCMFIRHDCLLETGALRGDAFAQGYGEENDWCLRARQLGWRHAAAPGVFVAHAGGRSFGAAKPDLLRRNAGVLEALHPGYDALVARFEAADPLRPARRALDRLRWDAGALPHGSALLVTHALGGGVQRYLRERCDAFRQQGLRPAVIAPAEGGCTVSDGVPDDAAAPANLRYRLPEEWPALLALLGAGRPRTVELHHMVGHDAEMAGLAGRLGLPMDLFVHDYHLWCPRITLCGSSGSYCGEPADPADCDACVADAGNRLPDGIGAAALRARSAALLEGARRVFAPTVDTARRVSRHSPGARVIVTPWEDDAALPPLRPMPARPMPNRGEAVVLVPGAIGADKGYDVLLACARDAARRALPLRFVVAGHTMDDDRLMATGRVFVTGRYEEDEAVRLVQDQDADVGLIPSVWPETWCYALSVLWRAGLHAAAFALGAQAERIRRTGRGTVLPPGLPPQRLNAELIRIAGALKGWSGPVRRAG